MMFDIFYSVHSIRKPKNKLRKKHQIKAIPACIFRTYVPIYVAKFNALFNNEPGFICITYNQCLYETYAKKVNEKN